MGGVMARKILCLTMLSFFLGMGGLWALRAQDPTPPQMPAQAQTTTQVDLSVAGTAQKCSFVPSRAVARGRQTPAAAGTEVANPVTVPMQTPSPSPTPMPSPTASPSPSPEEPTPSPTPSPSP